MRLKNLNLYVARLLSALCLFLILAAANVWLDPLNNTLLVLGYRLFIIATPFLLLVFRQYLTIAAFIATQLGLLAWLQQWMLVGTLLFATGIAISGYMLKYYAAFSTEGAAGNKIALNVGSIASGVLIMASQNQNIMIGFCFLVMIIATACFVLHTKQQPLLSLHRKQNQQALIFSKKSMAWALIGFVIGVKLIALVSILPQLLMQKNQGNLPNWFGGILILNSVLVVVLQLPVMRIMKQQSKMMSLMPLLLGMATLLFASQLEINHFWGACCWTVILSVVECCVSYLDTLSQHDGMLLIKEAAVGIGSASTVLLVRNCDPLLAASIIGVIAISCILICFFLFVEKPHVGIEGQVG